LRQAKRILDLCDRWHKLPDEILDADAGMWRLLAVESLGTPESN
jgi:hypothetical protein